MAISWSADTQHLQETYFRRTKSTKVVQASVSTKLCALERVKKKSNGAQKPNNSSSCQLCYSQLHHCQRETKLWSVCVPHCIDIHTEGI